MKKIIESRYLMKSSNFPWILQFPIFQQLAYFSIFLELYMIDLTDKERIKANQQCTIEVNNSIDKTKNGDETVKIAKECHMLNKKKTRVMNDFLQLKLYEAFLEAAPQAILQVMIVFRRGFSNPMDVFTILTSMLSLNICATDLFWRYPTQVSFQ